MVYGHFSLFQYSYGQKCWKYQYIYICIEIIAIYYFLIMAQKSHFMILFSFMEPRVTVWKQEKWILW